MAKDLKLVSKTDNFGDGCLDLVIKDGKIELVEKSKMIEQAIMKGTIAKYDPSLLYGAEVKTLRGLKFQEVIQVLVTDRILYLVSFCRYFYNVPIDIKSVLTSFIGPDKLKVEVKIGESVLEELV
jgi:hypothetical protein